VTYPLTHPIINYATGQTMFVNIQKAIELTGVSRSTLQRHIKTGKLSKTDKGIDTSELIRVYGALKNTTEQVKVNQSDNLVSEREQWLMAQIDQLQKDLKELKVESIEREKRLMALLEHQAGADKSGGLFGKWFK
jgi:uncharacterized protein YydD (DUF2326 family)